MGFPTPLDSNQKAITRASGYWQRTLVAFNPGEVVFQCEADADITDMPFKTFAWTNTLAGAYTDVWQGMVVYISSTSDYLKGYKYRGRVRLTPSATEFYIDLNATTLATGDLITVARDADLCAVVREADLVDGSIAYHDLPAVTTGLPSVLALYDSDHDGSVAYTPNQTGIAVADGDTIAGYAWAISGTGSSNISNPTDQNPTLTFEAGYHYLVRLTTTTTNGISSFMMVQVYAVTRTFSAPVIVQAVAGSMTQDLANGYTGSIIAYGGVANLPYRTQAVVFCVEHFGDNSSTPIVTNVLMYGRLRTENITTAGSAEAGQEQQVTYPIEGMASYLQRLRVPNDIVRAVASPDEWGEMVNPNPFRRAVYFLSIYTTLLNLVSFSAGDNLFEAWGEGGEPVSVDGGYALDTLNTILDRIKAAANYAPDGEIRCEINASYQVDRSGLVTIMDFLLLDYLSWALDIDTSKNTAQVMGYGGYWNTVNSTFVLFTAQSPSIVYGDAPETRELTRELLMTDSTTTEAIDELAARTGNDYAANNPKWLINTTLRDAHRWLIATNFQRYTWALAASTNTRGVAITTAIKWQCQSVNLTISTDGTLDTSAQFVQETEFLDAQNVGSLLPANLPQLNPVFPVLSDYPASPDNPLWGYPTDTPSIEELQPIDGYSAYMAWSSFPADQAAQAAEKQGSARCKTFQVLARNSGTTNSPWLTANTVPYTLKLNGFGKIGGGIISTNYNFATGKQGWDNVSGYGSYTPGQGFINSLITSGGFTETCSIGITIPSATVTRISVVFDKVIGLTDIAQNDQIAVDGVTQLARSYFSPAGVGSNITWTWTGSVSAATSIQIDITASYSSTNPPGGSLLIKNVIVETDSGSAETEGDWFYYLDSNGDPQLFAPTEGGLIDGNKPAVIPPYAESHEYLIPFTGTGNAIQAAYALADYTNTQNFAFTIQACRNP